MRDILKQMSDRELKEYLSENRRNENKFSEALEELMSRNPNPTIYPFEQSAKEIASIINKKIEEIE
ncbi:DUF6887 family protein [Anaplasma marginale]|uniref:DUF6887 family protein n=1 Tax=Anaplasma marginale TaxID=770 RepID=UPI0002D6C9D9|nr:hypothetical protein [Anaplasma marginale]